MEKLQNMQVAKRLSGTLLRLGWLVSVAAFIPFLFFALNGAITVGRAFFVVILIVIAMVTLFLLLLNDEFRGLLTNSESVDLMPMVSRVYDFFSVLIYILLAAGVALGVSVILLSLKEKDGKASKNSIISAICMLVVLAIGFVSFLATKSQFSGVSA